MFSFLRSVQTTAGYGLNKHYLQSREFENRLLRARTDELKIEEFADGTKQAAKIRNVETGHVHHTTLIACDCEDFMKIRRPCKHMIFLMLKTGRHKQLEKTVPKSMRNEENTEEYIPIYWEYYDGPPTGIGYANYYTYEVTGRKYGVSEKTGKPTNRRSRIVVLANSAEEAAEEAAKKGTCQPYETIELLDSPPSFSQIKYLNGAGIPHPNLMCDIDVIALLTRYEEQDDSRATKGIRKIANDRHVRISMFSSQRQIASYIWGSMNESEKVRFYCYAVYCQEKGLEIGETKVEYTDSAFGAFALTKKQIQYIEYTEPGYAKLDGRAGAYKAAKEYIKSIAICS